MKIAVLISGGVDSSVALKLLKDQGHDVTAFYLKIWLEDELSFLGQCPWEEDLTYVQSVCKTLKVPLQIVSLQQEYWDCVVSYTIDEVKAGRTPSPDLLCNQHIKFGVFIDKINGSFEKIATGHYAQVEERDGIYFLKKAKDPVKDQTYFLSRLCQQQLSRLMFPIGHLLKSEVRVLAEKFDLPTKVRKDSQGVCFLGKFKFSEFIKFHLGIKKGNLIEKETGKRIGKHDGYWFYTLGQRKGLGLSGGPWYVVSKDVKQNKVYISKNYFSKEKRRDRFHVTVLNWLSNTSEISHKLQVKIRHGEHLYGCSFKYVNDNFDKALISLNERDQGISAGQFAVFYHDDICLGSGMIG